MFLWRVTLTSSEQKRCDHAMKLISCQNGQLLTSLKSDAEVTAPGRIIPTGFAALDSIAPDGGLARGSIHEFLWTQDHGMPRTVSAFLARLCHFGGTDRGAIV